ncbi:DUF1788 domain-containing protein [Leptospira selangorensis]|uniref:DUF1788 domain-containing protein n=1 Tax=Leptospira selangorensis TaxID=2484982 RepID=A0ABY2NAQ7_9LEPT|nr:BREX protein BrxB domain-containing protein [Leptospira selangorensis]TGM20252.1 DUF1788 domain-containing protein [Leptospira selangorensis]
MSSLNSDFNELIERIKAGREYNHAGFDPIYYLVFSPEQILEVKRQIPAWNARLSNEGWKVHTFSMAAAIENIIESHKLLNLWINADAKSPLEWVKTNQSIASHLSQGPLQNKLESVLEDLKSDPKNILFITDIEALHPYLRIGAIEGQLQGKFNTATIFLYPGVRTGKTRLKFLGFYPEDGNYRSVHVGG